MGERQMKGGRVCKLKGGRRSKRMKGKRGEMLSKTAAVC